MTSQYALIRDGRVIATDRLPAPLFITAIERGWVSEWERYGAILMRGVEIRPVQPPSAKKD